MSEKLRDIPIVQTILGINQRWMEVLHKQQVTSISQVFVSQARQVESLSQLLNDSRQQLRRVEYEHASSCADTGGSAHNSCKASWWQELCG